MHDPNYPDRPSHPDFWRISSAVLKNDAMTDEHDQEGLLKALGVDMESISYVSAQRAARIAYVLKNQKEPEPGSALPRPPISELMMLMMAWWDAFAAGREYERNLHEGLDEEG